MRHSNGNRQGFAFLSRALLLASVAHAGAVMAQSIETSTENSESAEEIIVTGIRASLGQAADIKRDAPQLLDVITADDIGKLPDDNVAEALQRVTGVQITRVFGEGQAVSIRGLQQVRVEVDGRTVLGFSSRLSPPENDQLGRSSGLDAVPSSVFGRLEVRKSPLASQVEGGLGGTVNLVTPRPFGFRKPRLSLQGQMTLSDGSNKVEPRITGLATTTFADNRFGVLLSGEYQKSTRTVQTFERNNFFDRRNGGTATLQAPTLLQYEQFLVDRTRWGLNGSVQFQATPDLVFTAEGLYTKINTGRNQDFLAWRLPTSASAVIITNPTIVDNFIIAGDANGTLTTAGQIRNEPATSALAGFNGRYDDGTLVIEGDASYSRGTLEQTIQIITLQARTLVPGRFDFRDGVIPSLQLGAVNPSTGVRTPYDAADFGNFNPAGNGVRSNLLEGVLEEFAARLDLSYRFGSGVTLHGGLRFANLQARSNAFRSQVTPTRDELIPFLGTLAGRQFLGDIDAAIPVSFLTTLPTRDYVFNRAQQAQPDPDNPDGLLPNSARDYDLTEKTYAGYVMLSAEGNLGNLPYRANAGVRIIRTDFSVDTLFQSGTSAAPIFTPVNDRNRYTNVLPNANIAFNVTDDFLVRLSGSKTMQRAGVAELAPSIFVNITNRTATGGNADLLPPTSVNFDVSFEYYGSESSMISGAVFYKDVRNFIATDTVPQVFPGFEQLGEIPYTRPGNVASAKVKGFEVGIQHFFNFLPAPFDGLGVIANYTFSDAEDSDGFPLVATSKHSYNLIALFEKGPISARIAYNWRDEALFEFTQGRPNFIAPRSQLDAQLGIDITPRVAIQFQAQNLQPMKSATIEYSQIGPLALNSYALAERRYSAGLRARF